MNAVERIARETAEHQGLRPKITDARALSKVVVFIDPPEQKGRKR